MKPGSEKEVTYLLLETILNYTKKYPNMYFTANFIFDETNRNISKEDKKKLGFLDNSTVTELIAPYVKSGLVEMVQAYKRGSPDQKSYRIVMAKVDTIDKRIKNLF